MFKVLLFRYAMVCGKKASLWRSRNIATRYAGLAFKRNTYKTSRIAGPIQQRNPPVVFHAKTQGLWVGNNHTSWQMLATSYQVYGVWDGLGHLVNPGSALPFGRNSQALVSSSMENSEWTWGFYWAHHSPQFLAKVCLPLRVSSMGIFQDHERGLSGLCGHMGLFSCARFVIGVWARCCKLQLASLAPLLQLWLWRCQQIH